MATVHPPSPAGPTAPLPPQEEVERHVGDAVPDPPAVVSGEPDAAGAEASGGGGEIAALDKQLAVVVGGGGGSGSGDERRLAGAGAVAGAVAASAAAAGGGGKLVAEAMRKYAAPRSSKFHGVTRYEYERGGARVLPRLSVGDFEVVLWFDLGGLLLPAALIRGQAQVEWQVRGAPMGQHQPGQGPQAQGQARYVRYQPRTRALAHCQIV